MFARMYVWPRYALEVNGKRIVFPQKPGAALARLFVKPGAEVSMDEMIEAVYFDDPDGGPERANDCIRVFVCRMRKLLNKVGIEILGYRGKGGFRLVLPGQIAPKKYIEPKNGHHGPYVYEVPNAGDVACSIEDLWIEGHRDWDLSMPGSEGCWRQRNKHVSAK